MVKIAVATQPRVGRALCAVVNRTSILRNPHSSPQPAGLSATIIRNLGRETPNPNGVSESQHSFIPHDKYHERALRVQVLTGKTYICNTFVYILIIFQ